MNARPGVGRSLEIRETTADDLADLGALWADGEVMRFVGFPEGLPHDEAQLHHWLERIRAEGNVRHFVVRHQEGGFCGELFYRLDEASGRVELDIKLRPAARGRGIGTAALTWLIERVFGTEPRAEVVWVEPVADNVKAQRLYERCGLRPAPRPDDMAPGPSYWLRAKEMPPPTNP